jgi:ketosteroid isomerase-like protein
MHESAAFEDAANRDAAALEAVRTLERRRIDAIRTNDADTMSSMLDAAFLYINSSGTIYDKDGYVQMVRSRQLTYADDVELTETDHRVDGDIVLMAGKMLGHARLDGDQQVFHLRSLRVWRHRQTGWKLLAWQSSALW